MNTTTLITGIAAAIFLIGWWRTRNTNLRVPATWIAAATLAWLVADLLGVGPAFAASAALLTLSFTAVTSLASTLKDATVALAGIAAGTTLMLTLGAHAWVAGLAAATGWGVAALFKISPSTAVKIPAAAIAIFALSQLPNADTATDKIIGLVVGGIIGTLMSAVRTPNPVQEASTQLAEVSTSTAQLMSTISEHLRIGTPDSYTTREWFTTLNTLTADLAAAKTKAEEAQNSTRWSPLSTATNTGHLTVTINSLTHAHEQIRQLLHSLELPGQPIATIPVSNMLTAAAEAFTAGANTLDSTQPSNTHALTEKMGHAHHTSMTAARELRNIDDTQELLLSSGIIGGLARSVYGLDDDTLNKRMAPRDIVKPVPLSGKSNRTTEAQQQDGEGDQP